MRPTTFFEEEFRQALEGGADDTALKELVERYYASGGTKAKAYDAIQGIWLDYGFDEDEHHEANPKRDALELIMEQVWYWDD